MSHILTASLNITKSIVITRMITFKFIFNLMSTFTFEYKTSHMLPIVSNDIWIMLTLYTFIKDDDSIYIMSTFSTFTLQMWTPPTPPHDDNDIYIDQSLCFLYEHNTMPETQLPPIYIKKEHKKPKIESITSKCWCIAILNAK